MGRPVKKHVPLAKFIRQLLNDEGLMIEDVSEVLGKSIPVLRNKLSNGTFTIKELIAIVGMVDGIVDIHTAKNDYKLSPEDFDNELYSKIETFKNERDERKIKMLEKAIRSVDPDTVRRLFEKYMNS